VEHVRTTVDQLFLTLGYLHGLDLTMRILSACGVSRIAIEHPTIPASGTNVACRGGYTMTLPPERPLAT